MFTSAEEVNYPVLVCSFVCLTIVTSHKTDESSALSELFIYFLCFLSAVSVYLNHVCMSFRSVSQRILFSKINDDDDSVERVRFAARVWNALPTSQRLPEHLRLIWRVSTRAKNAAVYGIL